MLTKILILLLVLTTNNINGQDSIAQFSDVVRQNMKPYIRKAEAAYAKKDFRQGEELFDSLVTKKLINSRFDDLSIKNYNSNKDVSTNAIKKKIILITYASWYILEKKEIEIINKSALDNHETLEIILLFWDKKENLKKLINQFDKKIRVCYAHETYDDDIAKIALLKHTFGFPTSFSIDENKKIQNISHLKDAMSLKDLIPELLVKN